MKLEKYFFGLAAHSLKRKIMPKLASARAFRRNRKKRRRTVSVNFLLRSRVRVFAANRPRQRRRSPKSTTRCGRHRIIDITVKLNCQSGTRSKPHALARAPMYTGSEKIRFARATPCSTVAKHTHMYILIGVHKGAANAARKSRCMCVRARGA